MSSLVQVEQVFRISSPDGKVRFEPPAALLESIDGAKFMKVPQTHRGLARLVFHDCPGFPCADGHSYSLAASIGYKKIMTWRNEAQLAEFKSEDAEAIPDLFKGHQAEDEEQPAAKICKATMLKRRPYTLLSSPRIFHALSSTTEPTRFSHPTPLPPKPARFSHP